MLQGLLLGRTGPLPRVNLSFRSVYASKAFAGHQPKPWGCAEDQQICGISSTGSLQRCGIHPRAQRAGWWRCYEPLSDGRHSPNALPGAPGVKNSRLGSSQPKRCTQAGNQRLASVPKSGIHFPCNPPARNSRDGSHQATCPARGRRWPSVTFSGRKPESFSDRKSLIENLTAYPIEKQPATSNDS